jgi:ribosomal protein S18 acetylase RimI-like enzyme
VSPQLAIRRARESDIPELIRLRARMQEHLESCGPGVYRLSKAGLAARADLYRGLMARADAAVFVAADSADVPKGLLWAEVRHDPHIEPSTWGWLDDAWVEPEFRRQGAMRGLVLAATELLQSSGVELVLLDYVTNNPAAFDCWPKLGFRPGLLVADAPAERLVTSLRKPAS